MMREGKKSLATECRHYIYIQRLRKIKDGEGGYTETWHTILRCAAAIYPIRAQQLFEYRSINVEATHIIKIRGKIDILNEVDRIEWNSRIFEILTIENIQEQDWVKIITCKEQSLSGDESQTTTTSTTTTTVAPGP